MIETAILRKLDEIGDREHLVYLPDGRTKGESMTGSELAEKIRRIGTYLHVNRSLVRRIALVYPSGGTLFTPVIGGCMLSGKTIVPMKLPKPNRRHDRTGVMLEASQVDLCITVERHRCGLRRFLDAMGRAHVPIVTHEHLMNLPSREAAIPLPDVGPNNMVLLQFTSGSTGIPKRVELTLAMVEHNCLALAEATEIGPGARLYNWMPFFHDFGLIFGVFVPLFSGVPMHVASPMVFLQDPLSCLHGLADNRISHTAFASFALEHCVARTRAEPERLDGLDLAGLRKLMIGADIIHFDRASEFVETFSSHGFAPDAFTSGYGLAEATLVVSVSAGGLRSVSAQSLNLPRSVAADRIVNCGRPVRDVSIRIRRLGSDAILVGEGEIGEVLIAGPSVIDGHGGDHATVAMPRLEGRSWLPTGDLGFILNEELFVWGRTREILIVNGENHSPAIVEDVSLESLHLRRSEYQAASFVMRTDGVDRLHLVIECPTRLCGDESEVDKIRRAVFASTDLEIAQIHFCRRNTLPRTSSGKLIRSRIFRDYSVGSDKGSRWRIGKVRTLSSKEQ